MSNFQYVPILQTKLNEYAALQELENSIKEKIKPLFTLTNSEKERRAQDLPKQIQSKWGNLPCYIDLNINREFVIDSKHYATWIFERLNERGLDNIQIILTPSSSIAMINATANAIKNFGYSLAFRISVTEINIQTNNEIDELLTKCDLALKDVDLIIDFAENVHLNSYLHSKSIQQIYSELTNHRYFNKVIIAGSSIPKELPRADYNPHNFEPRTEWLSYVENFDSQIINYIFSDYASVHPEEFETDVPVKPNAKIKYTLDSDYMIMVRYQAHVHANGFEQFREIAEYLINSGEYYGQNYSSGDQYIYDCANNLAGTGNFGTWVKVAVNHHITVTSNQISNLFDTSI